MKKLLLALMLMATGFDVEAQNNDTPELQDAGEEVFQVVEKDPEFENGMEGLYQYLATHLQYPDEAKEKKIEGRVYVRFIVEKDGTVTNVEVIHSPDPMLGAEAVRVVEAMPKWKPGRQRGKKVRVQYNLPINFKL